MDGGLAQKLKTYNEQLAQVENLLANDPRNEQFLKRRGSDEMNLPAQHARRAEFFDQRRPDSRWSERTCFSRIDRAQVVASLHALRSGREMERDEVEAFRKRRKRKLRVSRRQYRRCRLRSDLLEVTKLTEDLLKYNHENAASGAAAVEEEEEGTGVVINPYAVGARCEALFGEKWPRSRAALLSSKKVYWVCPRASSRARLSCSFLSSRERVSRATCEREFRGLCARRASRVVSCVSQ